MATPPQGKRFGPSRLLRGGPSFRGTPPARRWRAPRLKSSAVAGVQPGPPPRRAQGCKSKSARRDCAVNRGYGAIPQRMNLDDIERHRIALGSTTARTLQRVRRGRVRCCASPTSSAASRSVSEALAHIVSGRSRPSWRRTASSMTSLSLGPVLGARSLTARSTSESIHNVEMRRVSPRRSPSDRARPRPGAPTGTATAWRGRRGASAGCGRASRASRAASCC